MNVITTSVTIAAPMLYLPGDSAPKPFEAKPADALNPALAGRDDVENCRGDDRAGKLRLPNRAGDALAGNRPPAHSPSDTAGLK